MKLRSCSCGETCVKTCAAVATGPRRHEQEKQRVLYGDAGASDQQKPTCFDLEVVMINRLVLIQRFLLYLSTHSTLYNTHSAMHTSMKHTIQIVIPACDKSTDDILLGYKKNNELITITVVWQKYCVSVCILY